MPLSHVIAGNEPPINNAPIFGAALDTMASAFSADASQYAAFRSFYAAVSGGSGPFPPPPPPPPPPVLTGVLSVNTADGVVVMDGANGVAVSSGATPTVSLGDITPTSLNASGTITAGGALTGTSGVFTNSMTAGSVSCASLGVTVNSPINTSGGVSAATVTASGAVSAASATVSGLTSAGTFAIPGAFSLASFLNGSLGTSAPADMSYDGTQSGFLTTICGWTIQWGTSVLSDYYPIVNPQITSIPITWARFNGETTNVPAVAIFSIRNEGGGGPFIVNGKAPPNPGGVDLVVSQNGILDPDYLGARVGWIAIGRSAAY